MLNRFHDRREAGRWLAGLLAGYANRSDTQVLALPRGGVPVAYEVARVLNAPLDVLLVRKLGVPGYDELAMGRWRWEGCACSTTRSSVTRTSRRRATTRCARSSRIPRAS